LEDAAGSRGLVARPAGAGARADLRQHRVRRAEPRIPAVPRERSARAHRVDRADRSRLQGPARRDRRRMSQPRKVVAVPGPGAKGSSAPHASPAVRGGAFVFVSGLTAVDPATGQAVRDTTARETQRILENLKLILEGAGSSLDSVVKVIVLLHSMLEAPN